MEKFFQQSSYHLSGRWITCTNGRTSPISTGRVYTEVPQQCSCSVLSVDKPLLFYIIILAFLLVTHPFPLPALLFHSSSVPWELIHVRHGMEAEWNASSDYWKKNPFSWTQLALCWFFHTALKVPLESQKKCHFWIRRWWLAQGYGPQLNHGSWM